MSALSVSASPRDIKYKQVLKDIQNYRNANEAPMELLAKLRQSELILNCFSLLDTTRQKITKYKLNHPFSPFYDLSVEEVDRITRDLFVHPLPLDLCRLVSEFTCLRHCDSTHKESNLLADLSYYFQFNKQDIIDNKVNWSAIPQDPSKDVNPLFFPPNFYHAIDKIYAFACGPSCTCWTYHYI
ncbi:MAG: hypothetical protein Sylvanvirus6_42 [Sylvanvirus sp.]|uniref:Uncharacterized protein n=1 Tax=Sylvanvirus sp. TaxID=2487774 RepID=A0A3G5AJM5_9VIRU|nr:MAG: hypothetical protein Sylvanvirus6_42 [Sylvanvirus sp.]